MSHLGNRYYRAQEILASNEWFACSVILDIHYTWCHGGLFFLSQYADVVDPHWHLDYHLILLFIFDFFDAVVRTTALFTPDVNS